MKIGLQLVYPRVSTCAYSHLFVGSQRNLLRTHTLTTEKLLNNSIILQQYDNLDV